MQLPIKTTKDLVIKTYGAVVGARQLVEALGCFPKRLDDESIAIYKQQLGNINDSITVGKATIALRTCGLVLATDGDAAKASKAKAVLSSLGDVSLPTTVMNAMKKVANA